jgi:hypothetical protein
VELHGVDIVLADGSWWRGRARRELSTASRRRRSGRRETAVEFGSGIRELVEEPKERGVGARAVLVHARSKVLGLRCGLSMATVRRRPSRAPGSRGTRKRGQRGGEHSRARGEDYTWKEEKQEVDGGGRGSCTGGKAGEAEEQRSRGGSEEEEEREKVRRTSLNFLESSRASW